MIRTDSRKVQKGDTFVALPGFSSDGDKYIESAISKGASRIVCRKGQYDVETVNTDDPRKYLEELLDREYGHIIKKMTLIALTGTNGKTTTSYLIAQALNRLGRKCAYIGTIGFYMDVKIAELPNTSVDICDLYELLLTAHDNGFDTVALEASSQGLDMGRLNTLSFDIAVFTNLTEDHLDYHKTMENYAAAKHRLFEMLKPEGAALINADDRYGSYFSKGLKKVCTFGLENTGADVKADKFSFENGETRLSYHTEEGSYDVRTLMPGTYNIYNCLAVIGTLRLLGYGPEDVNRAVNGLHAPDGRFDLIRWHDNNIVIDYAHTPDAVQKILDTAKEFTTGKIYTVFGCTGDRERQKRPVMTRMVLSGCSFAIITDDDVHTEDENRIIADMLEGNEDLSNYEVCLDRKEAIKKGMQLLDKEDTLLVLGKGHENFIVMKGYKIPHNDKAVVLEYTEHGF